MKNFIYTIIAMLCSCTIYAQFQVIGKITDSKTNKPLQGVNVFLLEQQKGTVTNDKGFYKLTNLPAGYFNIQYSYIGYITRIESIKPGNKDTIINIGLEPTYIQSHEIVVTAGGYSSQHENAIKVETIKASSLEETGSISMMKNIANIPGIDVISKGMGVTTPVIRGLSTTNVLVLNNGIRLENFQFSENHPFMLDESGVEKIEIIKGPASLLYGSDAMGGVLNIIKEKPAPIGSILGDYNVLYNTNTKGVHTGLGIKGTNKNFYWGIRGNIKSHTDYTDGSGVFVNNSRFNEKSAKFFTGLNKSFGSFKLYYDYNQMKIGLVVPAAIVLINENDRKNNVWYQNLDNHLFVSKNKFYLNDWQLETNLSYQYNHRKLETSPENEHFTNVDMQLQTITYEMKSKYYFSKDDKIICGYQGMYQYNKNGDAPSHVLPDYSINDNSLFGLYQKKLGEKFHTQLGLRYDFRLINVPEQEKAGHSHEEEPEPEHDEDKLEKISKNYSNINSSIGLTYHLSEKILLRSNLASAYRTPNIAELTQDGIHGARYEQGSTMLKSQRNFEADISSHYHSDKLVIDVGAFYNYIYNYIFLSPTTDTTENGQSIYKYAQNNSRIYGFEGSFEYLPLRWLSIKGNYAHIIGEQEDGNYLPFIPQNKFKPSVTLKKQKVERFENIFFRMSSEIAMKQIHPSIFESETDGYIIFNIGLGSSIILGKQKLHLNVSVNNILDREYFDHLSTLKNIGYYDIGRNITISLKIPVAIKK